MRKILSWLLVCVCLLPLTVNGQFQIITNDTSICPNTSLNLKASFIGITPTSVTLTDDFFTGTLPIGFSFNFFGNLYTSCVFSSNGYISFNTANAGMFSPWAITAGIPGNTGASALSTVDNSIMAFYADILPQTTQGTLDYATVGVAPNRKFIVSFCDVPMFSCTALSTSFQIILYETTNEIEVHLANVPSCTSWNNGYGIEGIQNLGGTVAYPVAGRNYPSIWTANHSSHRWTPGTGNIYSLTSIPYAAIPSAGSVISWFANGVTPVGTGDSIMVSPTANTFYVAQITKCQDTLRDTVYVTIGGGPFIDSIAKVDPTTCGGQNGLIKLYGLDSTFPYVVNYKKNGVTQAPINVVSTATGVVNMPNLSAGTYDSIIVYKGFCFSNVVGPITLFDPPVIADFNFVTNLGCEQDTVLFTNAFIQNPLNKWTFGDGANDTALNPTHIYITQGVYNVKLVVSNGICKDSITKPVNVLHPLKADFTVDDDSACTNQQITFTNTSTATGPSYFWSFGDTTTSTLQNPVHTYTVPGKYQVMMVVTDAIPCHDTTYMTIVVDSIPYVSFITSDSSLCEGQGVLFISNYLKDGNTNIVWSFGDGNQFIGSDQINHAYDSSGAYTVTLTASYRNCPDAIATKNINIRPFPSIDLGQDTTLCPNGAALVIGDFKNASNPAATWLWNTGDKTALISVRHPGIYTARISTNGCTGDDSIEVFKDCYIDIPNSFTPNGDGLNDYFLPRQLLSKSLTGFKMTIYNRWGQEIFQTTSINGRGWDGKFNDKEQPSGVYVYIIDATIDNKHHEHYEGNVTMLR